ncbi:MAG: 1-acyl-sn-glycerol-3-phosphate acyltransferase [Bacilli bacterium]
MKENIEKLNLAFDLDGIIIDLFNYQIKEGMRHFNITNIEDINIDKYDIKNIFNCNDEDRKKFWTFKRFTDYCLNSELIDGAVELINKLQKDGHEVGCITARFGVTENDIVGKYCRYLIEKRFKKEKIKFDYIDYCSEKLSPRDKLIACNKRKVVFLIEDKVDNALNIALNSSTKVIMPIYPNNKLDENVNGIIYVDKVNNAYDIIDNYSKELFMTHQKDVLKFKKNGEAKIFNNKKINNLSKEDVNIYERQLYNYYKNLPYNDKKIKYQDRNYKIAEVITSFWIEKYLKLNIINKEFIPYQDGVIYIANHLTKKDHFLISMVLRHKVIKYLAACELFDQFYGSYFNACGCIPIKRGNTIEAIKDQFKALNELTKLVVNNNNILLYPEGGRNKDDVLLKPFLTGYLTIAQQTGAPICPIVINDDYTRGNLTAMVSEDLYYVKTTDNFDDVNHVIHSNMKTMIKKIK